MINLKNLLNENDGEDENEDQIDTDRLYWNASYRDEILEKLGYHADFNKEFWEYPRTLYHCTPTENVPFIKAKGLTCQSKTRGINNRSVGHAIFTTQEEEEVESVRQSYGPVVFAINTRAMKQDGYTPYVTPEPEVVEALELAFIFEKLGKSVQLSQFIDSSGGINEYTVIVHENIPPKYLSIVES